MKRYYPLAIKALNAAKRFFRDESGQSTTEYVLLLLFVVMAVKTVGGTIRDRLKNLIGLAFDKTEGIVNEN